MIRGRAAERAIGLAAVHYRRAGRADIQKQATGMRQVGGTWVHAQKASIDFKGALAGGRSISIECKEHSGVSFPISESTLSTPQRKALDMAAAMGGEVLFVVDLPDQRETYVMQWADIAKFLAAPYRASLSLQWMRAHGLVAKATDRGTDRFSIWFLDCAPHSQRESAYLAEAADRAKSPLIELDARKDVAQSKSPAAELRRTDPEAYRRRIIGLAEQGIAKVMGTKPKTFGRRGRG